MSEQSQSGRGSFVVWLIVAVGVLFFGVVTVPLAFSLMDAQRFSDRHVEATPFIEAVYSHYTKTGLWPDEQSAIRLSPLPLEWSYFEQVEPTDQQAAPLLILHGPYHIRLVYRFAPPDHGDLSRRWVKSWEGDKTEFEATEVYRPKN
jgi:hypothetical protein